MQSGDYKLAVNRLPACTPPPAANRLKNKFHLALRRMYLRYKLPVVLDDMSCLNSESITIYTIDNITNFRWLPTLHLTEQFPKYQGREYHKHNGWSNSMTTWCIALYSKLSADGSRNMIWIGSGKLLTCRDTIDRNIHQLESTVRSITKCYKVFADADTAESLK